MLNRAVVSLLPLVPRPLIWRVSRRYIAGTSLTAALDLVADLNHRGMSATVDVLGEDTTAPQEAIQGRDLYRDAISEITRRGLDCNISIKLSQMGLGFDADLCHTITWNLAAWAEQHDNFLRLDMEDSTATSLTLDLYREIRRKHKAVGAVIQACMRRSATDVAALLSEGETNLRICKGIYKEAPDIAFQDREEVRDSFNSLLRTLLLGGAQRVGIATHDPPLVEFAKKLIERERIPRERYEFQMLLGVAERLRGKLIAAGHPLRVYVPFGEAWFAYSFRRLRENPEIAGHVIRNLFRRS